MEDKRQNTSQARIADALEKILSIVDPHGHDEEDGYRLPQKRIAEQLDRLKAKIEADGGIYAKIPMHICSSDEYDHATGKPTIENPDVDTLYLVPSDTSSEDMFDEWIYTDGRWEKFGSGGTLDARLGGLSDVVITDVEDKQAIFYDQSTETWKNQSLQPFCFAGSEEEEIIFDAGNISQG